LSHGCHNWVRIRRVDGGRLDTIPSGKDGSRVVATQSNSAYVRLGVKWSQVQILSARKGSKQVRGGFGKSGIACRRVRNGSVRQRVRQSALGLGLFGIGAHCPNMARIARSRLARISTDLARSSGSHTNSDTLVGMPFSSV
jgi:hypothetical protein